MRALENVHPDHDFVSKTGNRLKSLYDLYKELEHMSDSEFEHHVHEDRNDFQAWVHKIVRDKGLAKKLEKQKTREGMAEAVRQRIHSLEFEKKERQSIPLNSMRRGMKEFSIGLVVGLAMGFMVARAFGLL